MSAPSARVRSLWPREHGAYIQLLVPLITSLLATGLRWAAVAIAVGAGFAFLASEPLRVMLGGRGPRMREATAARARTRFATFAALALMAGGTGLALAPATVSWLALPLAPLVAFVIVASRRGNVQTVLGECVAAVALAGAGAPVAVAGGMNLRDALVVWSAWSLAYATTVIVVHHVIAHHRRASSLANARSGISVVLLCGTLAAWITAFPLASFATPLAIAAVLVLIWVPRATRLRAIGIAFLASSVLAALCAITTLRRSARDNELENSFRAAMAAHHPR
ncbi:MAG: YwiC-like family protein [Gemmatimonadales bacterium]|nr:YwiC-like family protein [Gemmatimonadales bacterium]